MASAPLPTFSNIDISRIEPTINALCQSNLQQIDAIVATANAAKGGPTWENLMAPIEALDDTLSQYFSPISHLNAVCNDDALRNAYNACLPVLADYATNIGQNKKLYDAMHTLMQSPAYVDYAPAQQKILEDNCRDFKLSGIDLSPEKQQRYKTISQSLSTLSARFEENVLDCANAWSAHYTDNSLLTGMPQRSQTIAQEAAKAKNKTGWLLTLDFPCYHAVMTHADSRELRKTMYTAYATRASNAGPHDVRWDNSDVMQEILALRAEKAKLVNFKRYSEYSLAPKMADTPEEVLQFLNELVDKTKPQAQTELSELKRFAREHLQLEDLHAWDIAYASEKLRVHQFDLSQEQLRPYFPITRVLPGFFDLISTLFGIAFRRVNDADTWHADVEVYALYDEEQQLRGHVYLDLYAREKKRSGAWMDDCRGRRQCADGSIQRPIAFVTCNFSQPSGGNPALLDHDEVLTLFHEFGHALHHLLTQVNYADAAGINGVPWDAVEFPSQFMEHWCWTRETLERISGHFETNEKLPNALFQKMLDAKHFQAGMSMLRQLEFSLFDFRMHHEYEADALNEDTGAFIERIMTEVRQHASVMPAPPFNRFAHSFSHIFAGGYAAGYYSYKWAEVLACDAFTRFEEEGLFNPAIGHDFLQHILEKGGSESPKALFVAFRGREPKVEPLLEYAGIAVL